MTKLKILVAYHKKERLYKNSFLVPVHCGRALMTPDDPDREWLLENLEGDDSGENISAQNKDYCELTAVYWAWKNYDKIGDPEFIGLNHYRRLWYMGDDFETSEGSVLDQIGLTEENISKLIDKYSLVHPRVHQKKEMTFKSFQPHFKLSADNWPMLYRGYQEFEKEHRFHSCNMFIFPKEVFFHYCEMLFDCLFTAQKHIEESKPKNIFPRYYGTVAEFLTSFYQMQLVKTNKQYAAKELPVVYLDLPNAVKV